MQKLLFTLFVSFLAHTHLSAAELGSVQLSSGDQQVALVELYTSEGCSSCPPADLWMSSLKSNERLWKDYVPVALHVDYWNYIGWKDRFSKAKYTNRQQNYVRNGGARVAYTPGFFSNGAEWRGWFNGDDLITNRLSVGNLSVSLDGHTVAARFDPQSGSHRDMVLNIAVLGMTLESDVRAGENNGKNLKHDFVALDVNSIDMRREGDAFEVSTVIGTFDAETDDLAIAAWVSEKDDQTPVQAVGGYIR